MNNEIDAMAAGEMTSEERIRAAYGNVSLGSDPVDPDNPTYSSLLGALKAVYEGSMPMEVLVRYCDVLTEKTNMEKAALSLAITKNPPNVSTLKITMSAFDLVSLALDAARKCTVEPTHQNMAYAVSNLMVAMDKIEKIREADI